MARVTVKFFAQVRELAGVEEVPLSIEDNATLDSIRQVLSEQNESFKNALAGTIVMARNQTIVKADTKVADGDEIAFFPPVTGG
ncbi:molybdopterin converting factor subunit 1 [Alteromonas sediminis]|uniref:Molybdopterin synthase sulfur carrier subunit n=1 Tax=Alteromonas sediminis TaxID=2259342 RepID=A0A3N5Y285_9ALTE|nr:molybdopterin converting factor subunit 1 [Alteromonas sediminis]RPJ67083.1 molybdopterin converting factor subunit 1 [Alteromonas sediminis]